LIWFGYVIRREEIKAVRIVMKMNVEEKRGRGRPNKRWLDTIENDMRVVVLPQINVKNLEKNKCRTKFSDPK